MSHLAAAMCNGTLPFCQDCIGSASRYQDIGGQFSSHPCISECTRPLAWPPKPLFNSPLLVIPHIPALIALAQIDGDWKFDSRRGVLVWTIELIDETNNSGSMEFVVSVASRRYQGIPMP